MPSTVKGGFVPSKHGAVLEDIKSRSPLLLKGEGSVPILLPWGGVLLWQWEGLVVQRGGLVALIPLWAGFLSPWWWRRGGCASFVGRGAFGGFARYNLGVFGNRI